MPELTDVTITEEDVLDALNKIRDGSAPGPDGIATKLILGLKQELTKTLNDSVQEIDPRSLNP